MKARLSAALALAAVTLAGCTVHQTEAPGLTGPSGLALTLNVNANPDTVSHDGGSQSSIKVTAIGPDGRGVRGQTIRMDMRLIAPAPCSVETPCVQDYGSFSARSIVTDGEGVAFTVYTAPPSPAGGLFETCGPLPGTCVDIVATTTGGSGAAGGSAEAATSQSTRIRLVPIGFIQPPAGFPTAAFTFSPQPAAANVPVLFDASASQVGSGASQIVSYNWTFGDGTSGTGKNPTHTYTTGGNYPVKLTVTNDRTRANEISLTVSVGAGANPTALFVFSPTPVVVGVQTFFDASASAPAPGHTIASYTWNFGDGDPLSTRTSPIENHDFGAAGSYTVVLTVTDEAGQKGTTSQTVAVTAPTGGSAGAPVANFTSSPTGPVVNEAVVFDSSSSTVASGRTITNYAWNFGDDTPIVNGNNRIFSHTYTRVGTFVVNLVLTDNTGATGQISKTVTVTSGNPTANLLLFKTGGNGITADGSGSFATGTATITSYRFIWGDATADTVGAASSAPHTYVAPGAKTVTLVVTDSLGRTSSAQKDITVP